VTTALLAYAFTVALFLYVFGDVHADSHTRLKHVGLSLAWPLTLAYVVVTFLREKVKER
jgi:ACR3 family arsenite efflux pump ArsB